MSNSGTFEKPQTTDTLGPESSQSNDSSLEHFRLISDRLSPEHLNCSTDQPILEALKLPELDELRSLNIAICFSFTNTRIF